MKSLRTVLWALLLACLAVGDAYAGSSTITVTPGSGATYDVTTDSTGNFIGRQTICDGAAGAYCVTIKNSSTAPVASDFAEVVAISPNSPMLGSVGGGTAASLSVLTGGVYNSAAPSLSNGQQAALQLTAAGQLIVDVANTPAVSQSGTWNITNISGTVSLPTGASTSANQTTEITDLGTIATNTGTVAGAVSSSVFQDNVKQWDGTALGAPSNYGTSPGAVAVPGVNAYITNVPAVSQSGSWTVTGSGNFTVTQATGSNLHIVCDSGCSTSTAPADEATFTPGTTSQSPVGGFYQTTATSNPLTNGQMGAMQLTANRALFTNLRNSSGVEIGTASTPVQVSLANTGANATPVLVTGSGETFPVTGTVTANAGTNLNTSLLALESGGNLATLVTDFGAPGATACASDTASCSLNQQMQRLAQRLTTINTTLGSPFQAGGSIGNTTFAATQATASALNATVVGTGTFAVQLTGSTNNINNISGTISLPTGASTSANQSTEITSLGTIAGAVSSSYFQDNVGKWDGTALGAPSNYGTSPGAVEVPGVNAFVTNSVAVTGTFYQTTQPISIASAQVASGAFASGSLAAGSMVDLLTMRAAIGGTTGSPADVLVGGCQYNSSAPTYTTGDSGAVQCTAAGSVHTTIDNSASPVSPGNGISAPTGTPPSVSQPTTSFNEMYNGTAWDAQQDDASKNLKVAQQATPTGGASTTGNIAANNTTAVVLKSSAGTVYGVQVYGIGSAPAYLKLYNATSETCGSGTPVKRLMIPAAPTAADGAGSNVSFGPQGIAFGTGITYCVTTGITDSDTTAPAASTFLVNVDWD